MTLAFDGTGYSVGLGSVKTEVGGGGIYRVGDTAIIVNGTSVAAFNDDGEVFEAKAYDDPGDIGVGSVTPYFVHDNDDGTFNIYYQIRDATPLPVTISNMMVTLNAKTGAEISGPTAITEGVFGTNSTSMLIYAKDLPGDKIFIIDAFRAAHIVDAAGTIETSFDPLSGTGGSAVTLTPNDVAVSGDKLIYTYVANTFSAPLGVKAQIFNLDGTEAVATFDIVDLGDPTFGQPVSVQVETLADGRFAVAWSAPASDGPDTDSTSVHFKVFNPDGSTHIDNTLVNTEITKARQDTPLLIATEDGFIIGYSVLDFSGVQEGRLKEYNLAGDLIDELEGAYNFAAGTAIRTDNNTAFILDGEVNELILPGADTALETGTGGSTGKTLVGNGKANKLNGGAKDDDIRGKGGKDTLKGKGGEDRLRGDGGNDKLFGGAGADKLEGGAGSDKLFGGGGKDKLLGGGGADRLDGGKGNDVLTGGKGADAFVFKKAYGKDTITDFKDDQDTIALDDALWKGTLTKQKVINKYAAVDGDDIVFDFGKHELKIKGFTDLSELKDDIEFI